ncbi:hypothetical protein [Acaryochloris marina]|uniref:hypothetical protein n=1 Tax=Acaryochloris marina TaxID=155978 RepID=UPI0002FB1D98|nr:hypothetical protein [Acaryochloris marina]
MQVLDGFQVEEFLFSPVLITLQIEDLDALIGKRVQQPILHPLNGTVLVQGGMMITRSIVSQLKEALVQIDELLARR